MSQPPQTNWSCRNCIYLEAPRFPPPGPAIGTCGLLSKNYAGDLAWSEVGNQFVPIYVTAGFACKHYICSNPLPEGKPCENS